MDFIPVSIIIPNYNGEHILNRSLAKVVEAGHAYPGEYEIIIVDDASQDNSIQLISDNFSEIKLVLHNTNKGFAEAVHSGVRSSIHSIILLLNTDVFPDCNFIAPLIRWFSREDTFCVSPLITDRNGSPNRVSWNRGIIIRGEIRKRNWELNEAVDLVHRGRALKSLFAEGGAAAIRKDMFLQLGGFLSIYKPFYYEDCDLCIRAWRHGWKTYFEPDSTVVHDHQQGTIRRFFGIKKIRIIKRRNRLFCLWLNLSTRKLIFSHIPWIFLRLLLRLLKMDLIYALALFNALGALRETINLRKILHLDNYSRLLEDVIAEISDSFDS